MSKEKRKLGDYEIVNSIYIGDKEVVFGVDKTIHIPFLVSYCDCHNPLGQPWDKGVGCDDYLEAMQIFIQRVQSQIEQKPNPNYPNSLFDKTVFTKSIVFQTNAAAVLSARLWLSMQSRYGMNISTLLFSLCWLTAENGASAAEVTRCSVLALLQAKKPDGKGTMYLAKSSLNVCPIGQRKLLLKSRQQEKRKSRKVGRNADMEIRALTPAEQKYTYTQSMQLEGQTANIGHLRGDFDSFWIRLLYHLDRHPNTMENGRVQDGV